MGMQLLSNGRAVFSILNEDGCHPWLVERLLSFLAPQFSRVGQGRPYFQLILRPFDALSQEWGERASETIVIRKGSAALFNLQGQRCRLEDGSQLVVDQAARTAYQIYEPDARVIFYGSDRDKELIEPQRFRRALGSAERSSVSAVAALIFLPCPRRSAGSYRCRLLKKAWHC